MIVYVRAVQLLTNQPAIFVQYSPAGVISSTTLIIWRWLDGRWTISHRPVRGPLPPVAR